MTAESPAGMTETSPGVSAHSPRRTPPRLRSVSFISAELSEPRGVKTFSAYAERYAPESLAVPSERQR